MSHRQLRSKIKIISSMKKTASILFILFLTAIMQAQTRTQPKPGVSPTVNIKKPQTFILPNGLKVMIVENHKLPRVTFNLAIDTAPYAEGNKKGVNELCSNLIGNGTKNISKDVLNAEIDFLGANVNFSAQGAFASSLSKYSGRILELLSEGSLHPVFTQIEFDKEKEKLLEGLKFQEKSVPFIAERVVNALAFGTNHPSGEYVTETTINNISLEDVIENYQNYFVPEKAYLVIVGDVKYKTIKPIVEKLFSNWKKGNVKEIAYVDPENVPFTQINFVDVSNAVQTDISLVNTLNLKMNDADFFAAVLATNILGGDFNSYLNMNLREQNGWTYGASSTIGSGKYVTKIRSTSAVNSSATDSAVVEFIKEIKKIRTVKVSNEFLNDVKAGFIGRFVMKAEKPEATARHALNIETEDLPTDFYENYIKTINAVTPEDILRVANKYFLIDNTRIVIVGKESEILPGLEKLNIPLFHFDNYANPIKK